MDFSKWKCFQIGTAKTEPASIQRRLNCCNICNFLSQDTISYQIARQERIFSYPFQKMVVEYLSRSTVANMCKSLRCCSFHPLVPKSGIHLNFLDRKVVSLLFSDGFCPNGLSVETQRHRIHQLTKKRKKGPDVFFTANFDRKIWKINLYKWPLHIKKCVKAI